MIQRTSPRMILMALATLVAVAGCGGKEQRLAAHLEKSRTMVAQADYEKARIELKNVLQIDPKVAEAHYLAGLIEEHEQEWQKAFGSFQRAIDLDPANDAARRKLGRLYLLGGDPGRALEAAEHILATKPEDAGALTLKAAVLAGKGDRSGAMKIAAGVIGRDPTQVDAVAVLAGVQTAEKDPVAAEKTLSAGIAASPKNVELRLALIALHVSRNEMDKAQQQYAEVIGLEPEKVEHRVGLARLQAAVGDIAAAEQTLRKSIEAKPEEDRRYLVLADFLVSRKGAPEAQKFLTSAIASRPQAYALQFSLAGLQRNGGELDQAEKIYRGIVEKDKLGPDALRARDELAELRLRRGRPDEAAALIAEVLKENARDNQALMLRGQMSLDRGDALSAIADFRSVLKDQPNSTIVMTQLARAHLANAEPELARETLSKAVALYPTQAEVRILMAELRAATKDTSGALDDLKAVLAEDPTNYRALNARADVYLMQQNWKAAEDTLRAVKKAYPSDPRVDQRIGTLYVAQRQYDKAIAAYESALSRVPGAIEPLTGLANAYFAQKKPELAVAKVEKAIEGAPNNFLAYALLGRLEGVLKHFDKAEASFRKAVEINPRIPGTHVELANFFLEQGKAERAIDALQEGLKILPADNALSFRLAEAYRMAGRIDESIAAYDDMIKRDAGNDLAANNLASILLDGKEDKASHERALGLAQRFERSANPAYIDTLGWASFKLGDFTQAVLHLNKATEKAPQVAIFQFHLGMALHKRGDAAMAKPYLQKAVESKAQIPGIEEAKKILAAG